MTAHTVWSEYSAELAENNKLRQALQLDRLDDAFTPSIQIRTGLWQGFGSQSSFCDGLSQGESSEVLLKLAADDRSHDAAQRSNVG